MLHEAILSLPPQYRIVLVLHDMEELDTELVAKILSIQPGTVRVRLHRARLLVRQEMARLQNRPAGRPKQRQEGIGAASGAMPGNLRQPVGIPRRRDGSGELRARCGGTSKAAPRAWPSSRI